MHKPSLSELRRQADRLTALRSPEELARALGASQAQLETLASEPQYQVFSVPKRDGAQRLIEDPAPPLKALQRRLNDGLQAVYFFEKSEAAYGFVRNAGDDPMPPRHIVTHAERHLGCRRLMNIDLEDFFHQISTEAMEETFSTAPFRFSPPAAALLSRLCTWKGRLPMGAPTSPAASNLAFREEDLALTQYARARDWLYTRYADDLTFSTKGESMEPGHLTETIGFIEAKLGFTVHPKKRRFAGDGEPKSVTRLVLDGNQVRLPSDFFAELDNTINDLGAGRRVQHRMGGRHTPWLSKYEQRLLGMLAFAEHVLGEHDPQYRQLLQRYQAASAPPPEDFGAYTWLDFPYF